MNGGIFVTGIGTGVGKTVVAAALTAALEADYWKPVQSGSIEGKDSDFVRRYLPAGSVIHPERYCLREPLSPHAAAELEKVSLHSEEIEVPETDKCLVIEGAGGLLVPLNQRETMIDLVTRFKVPVLLVVRQYLGSINHSLLSIEALRSRSIPLLGVVFNGAPQRSSEEAILSLGKVPCIARLEEYSLIDGPAVSEMADRLLASSIVQEFAHG